MFSFLPASRPPSAGVAPVARWGSVSVAAHAALAGALLGSAAGRLASAPEDGLLLPAFVAADRQAQSASSARETVQELRLRSPTEARPDGTPGARLDGTTRPPASDGTAAPRGEPMLRQATSERAAQLEVPRMATEVDRAAQRAPDAVNPPYPEELAKASIEGFADLQFVVDTLGHVEPASVVILGFTHRPFADAVVQTLPRMRYSPAIDAGVTVRQLVQQRFMFQLLKASPPPDPTPP